MKYQNYSFDVYEYFTYALEAQSQSDFGKAIEDYTEVIQLLNKAYLNMNKKVISDRLKILHPKILKSA